VSNIIPEAKTNADFKDWYRNKPAKIIPVNNRLLNPEGTSLNSLKTRNMKIDVIV